MSILKINKNIAQKICTILCSKLLTFANGCGILLSRKGKRPRGKRKKSLQGFPDTENGRLRKLKYSANEFGKEGESDGRHNRAAVFSGNVRRLVYTAGLLRNKQGV